MASRSFVATVVLSFCCASAAHAADNVTAFAVQSSPETAVAERAPVPDPGVVPAVAVTSIGAVEPWTHPSMPERMQETLAAAFTRALETVEQVPECRALFEGLGADPVEMLSTTLYFPANPYKETTRCRSALAFTTVGGAPTRLCRRFGFLNEDEAAMVVVHEALHHAGLTERPHDPDAMSGGAINRMVRRACGF